MRTPRMLPILVAATMAACSQSLTADMTGTGGITTGAGAVAGEGGFVTGTGGAGGVVTGSGGSYVAACNMLEAEYQSALAAAGNCQVGVPDQCNQLVDFKSLSECSCPAYVNDTSVLVRIENSWGLAGCPPNSLTCINSCPPLDKAICVSTDGGSEGYCSYVPGTATGGTGGGATGGTSGAGGSVLDGGSNPTSG